MLCLVQNYNNSLDSANNDCRIATLSKSYLTFMGIIMQRLSDNSNIYKLKKIANRFGPTKMVEKLRF